MSGIDLFLWRSNTKPDPVENEAEYKRRKFHYPGGQDHDQMKHGNRGGVGDIDPEYERTKDQPQIRQIANVYTPAHNEISADAYKGLSRIKGLQTLKDFEAEARDFLNEYLIAIDAKTGERVALLTSNNPTGVSFDAATQIVFGSLTDAGNLIMSHNHPNPPNNSFSSPDIATAIRYNVREMRVVTTAGVIYRMIRGRGGWPQEWAVGDEYARAVQDMMREMTEWEYKSADAYKQSDRGYKEYRAALSKAQQTANNLHYHEVWTRVAKKFPNRMRYERVLPDKNAEVKTWDDLLAME